MSRLRPCLLSLADAAWCVRSCGSVWSFVLRCYKAIILQEQAVDAAPATDGEASRVERPEKALDVPGRQAPAAASEEPLLTTEE